MSPFSLESEALGNGGEQNTQTHTAHIESCKNPRNNGPTHIHHENDHGDRRNNYIQVLVVSVRAVMGRPTQNRHQTVSHTPASRMTPDGALWYPHDPPASSRCRSLLWTHMRASHHSTRACRHHTYTCCDSSSAWDTAPSFSCSSLNTSL